MKRIALNKLAKNLCLVAPALLTAHASLVSADAPECNFRQTQLTKHVFARHRAEPTTDTRVAIHAWLCEGKSDAFLASQPSLPSGTSDLQGWTRLLGAIDGDTAISSAGSNADVATFRTKNCAREPKHQLMHLLRRAADRSEFAKYAACEAQWVAHQNAESNFWDLDLSCDAEELINGDVVFSVRGYDASQFTNSQPGLTSFELNLQNLVEAPDNVDAFPSGEVGTLTFRKVDPALESSIGFGGSFEEFGYSTYFYCGVNVETDPASATPYGIPPEVECAFERNRVGSTACATGFLEQECRGGSWVDTNICSPVWSDDGWQAEFPVRTTFTKNVRTVSTYYEIDRPIPVRDGRNRVNLAAFGVQSACSSFTRDLGASDLQSMQGKHGQLIRYRKVDYRTTFYVQRPSTNLCFGLTVEPTTDVAYELGQGAVGAVIQAIGASLTTR